MDGGHEGGHCQLFELAPPMDPPASAGPAGSRGSGTSPARPRPVNLPGLSAGLAAISANYGCGTPFADHEDPQQSIGNHFKSTGHQHQQQCAVQSPSLVPPLMAAAAFRRPMVQQFQQAQQQQQQQQQQSTSAASSLCPPLIYSPYGNGGANTGGADSQPSDPCTPSTLGTSSTSCLSTSGASQHSPYSAFSPLAGNACGALDPLGMGQLLWQHWPFFGTGGDMIAYSPEHPHQLLLHSQAHLLQSPIEVYSGAHAQGVQGSGNQFLFPAAGHLLNEHFFGEHAAAAALNVVGQPQQQSHHHQRPGGGGGNKTSVTAQGGQEVQQAASSGQMPRGQPRKGGRRPKESENTSLSKDEQDRRDKRRERNKQAAARCRKRREEKMAELQEQVDALREENADKVREVLQLRNHRDLLMEELARLGVAFKLDQLDQMAVSRQLNGGGGGTAMANTSITTTNHHHHNHHNSHGHGHHQQRNTRKRNLATSLQQQNIQLPPFKMEPVPQASSTAVAANNVETPGSPPTEFSNGVGNNSNAAAMLVNGSTDPVISESMHAPGIITTSTPSTTAQYDNSRNITNEELMLGSAKRHKYDQVEGESSPSMADAGAQQTPPNTGQQNMLTSSSSARPTSLHLDLLFKEGFVPNTPSKGLVSFGDQGSGAGSLGCFLGTPGSELQLTTPMLSHFSQLTGGGHGVLMAQQTGLTPCQHGPVLVQHQDGSERPPNGDLSELR